MARPRKFRTHKYSSRPEGPRADSTRTTDFWQAARADSNPSEPTRPEEFKVCRARRADSNCKESTRSIIRADSKTSEPTQTTHTDKITASFFSLFENQILKRLDSKSQRSESWKTSLKGHKAPLEDIQERRGKREEKKSKKKRACALIPSNTQGEPRRIQKNISSPHPNQKASWRLRRRSSKAQEAQYNIFFKAFQAATTWQQGFVFLVVFILIFLYEVLGQPLKPSEVLGQPLKPSGSWSAYWNQVRFLVSL